MENENSKKERKNNTEKTNENNSYEKPDEKNNKKLNETCKKEEMDPRDTKIEELTDLVKRTQANFENFRKRIERDQKDFVETANAELLKELLDIIDNFELAFKNEQSPEDFKKGVELIFAQLKTLLENNNVTEFGSLGKKFDPRIHEAMMQSTDSTKENEIVLEEFQKGYMIGEKVLRPSKVKINKN